MADFESALDKSDEALEIWLVAEGQKHLVTVDAFITRMRAQGISDVAIRQTLLTDLATNGPMFGSFHNAVEKAAGGTVNQSVSLASDEVFKDEFGEDYEETWICALVKTCPDCLPRHGLTKPVSEWNGLGRPPTWGSVCDPNCKCQLIPTLVSKDRAELQNPLIREKKKLRKEGHRFPKNLDEPKTARQRKAVSLLGQLNA